jgi:hypothetical protein
LIAAFFPKLWSVTGGTSKGQAAQRLGRVISEGAWGSFSKIVAVIDIFCLGSSPY